MGSSSKTPSWLLALGSEAPPDEIDLAGVRYDHERSFKHDFFAFTGCYRERDGERRVVLKIGRRASFFGLPLSWIGRLHARHEAAIFAAVDDLPLVPAFTGRLGSTGLTHAFVPGRPLARGEAVPDGFFEELERGLASIHERGVAIVDLEKPDNVLLGEDGRPWLFDFQISYRWPFSRGGQLAPVRWILRRLQDSDRYHLRKLRRRFRPYTMTPEELEASKRRPWPIRLHRRIAQPLQAMRRGLLRRVDPRDRRPGEPREERGRIRSADESTTA